MWHDITWYVNNLYCVVNNKFIFFNLLSFNWIFTIIVEIYNFEIMKRKEENRSVIEPSCTFFKPNNINFLLSNRVLDRKPDRVTGYKVLINLTSLVFFGGILTSSLKKNSISYYRGGQFYWKIKHEYIVKIHCG